MAGAPKVEARWVVARRAVAAMGEAEAATAGAPKVEARWVVARRAVAAMGEAGAAMDLGALATVAAVMETGELARLMAAAVASVTAAAVRAWAA